ncbi:MAG: type II secretion system F family protein [Gammaproteobacteria bacterium]|nr:type II secretion system F family protein [Gammaproteobacteria bacterium]
MAAKAKKQTTFIWEGQDKNGRTVKGENESISATYLRAILRRQGIKPSKIRKQAKPLFSVKNKKVTPKDISIVTRQMATMINAGIPIAQSLEILSRSSENPSLRETMNTIRMEVEAGNNLSSALAKFPILFDELYRNLVTAGEQSGMLDTMMDKIADYKEKIESIKAKIKSALIYPAVTILVAFVVTAILMIFVIPQFEALFANFGAELPSLTQGLIDLSGIFQEWWWAIFGSLIGGAIALAYLYKRSPKMRYALDKLQLRLPVVGSIVEKATIARFTRTLATMFGAGVPLVEALDSVAGACGNRLYYNATLDIKADVSTGQQLALSMTTTGLFPVMVTQMVGIGEESGEIETMLDKVADFYEAEVDDAVAAMSSLIEPMIMVVIGGLVGTMVVGMYLPIFKMAAVV